MAEWWNADTADLSPAAERRAGSSPALATMTNNTFLRRNITSEEVIYIVSKCYSLAACLKSMGLGLSGTNYKWLNTLIEQHRIDCSHFTGQGHLRNKTHGWTKKFPLEEILVIDSTYGSTSNLKKRLYDAGLLIEECTKCTQGPIWNGEPLVLHLDHIDGDRTNNLLDNLQILCPNCHSQTPTYCGRNKNAGPVRKLAKRVDLESTV